MRRSLALVLGLVVAGFLTVSGCGPSSPKVPDTPDGTITTVMRSLADNKPEVLWAALPASYQKQLQDDVVHAFATQMDSEVYSKSVAVLKKLTGLLQSKKDLIVPQITANPMVQMAGVEAAKIEQNWGKVVGLFETVLNSELGDIEKLKTVDVGSFLRTTGGKVMAQVAELSGMVEGNPYKTEFQAKAAAMTVEVVQVEGDKATVKSTIPGEGSTTAKLVKVEGKWLPEEMVEGWNEGIGELKAQIAAMDPKQMAAMKPQILGGLAAFDAALDQLAKATTAEEMAEVLGGILENLPIPMGFSGMGGRQELPPGMIDIEDIGIEDIDVEDEEMIPEDVEEEPEAETEG